MGRGEAKVNGQQVGVSRSCWTSPLSPAHCHVCPHARTTSSLANCFLEKTWLVQRSSHGQKPCGMKAEAATSLFQPLDGCGYGPRTGRNPGVADSMAGAGPAPRYPRQRQMLVLAEDRHACTHRHAPPCTNPLASTAMHSPISICHHARTHRQHSMASILLMHSPISIHPPACTRWQASC